MLLNKTRDVTTQQGFTMLISTKLNMQWEPSSKKLTEWARCGPSLYSATSTSQVQGLWILKATSTTSESFIPILRNHRYMCFECAPEHGKVLQLVPGTLPLSLMTWQF